MKRLLSFTVGLAVAFLFVQGITGVWAKPPGKWKQPTWKNAKDQYDEITAVDLMAKTVSIHHVGGTTKEDHTLTVGTFADITVDDKKATIADLKKGMRVDFSLGGDGTSLDRLQTITPPAPPPTPVPTATPSFPSKAR